VGKGAMFGRCNSWKGAPKVRKSLLNFWWCRGWAQLGAYLH